MSAFQPHAFERSGFSSATVSLLLISRGNRGFSGAALKPRHAIIKRTMDILLALVGIAIMGIPMLVIAVAIRLTSKGPALFRQARVGLNGRRFVVLKFRTMRHSVDATAPFLQATRDDPRVTPIGALLRHTSLDELPQFLNVLTGSMSLVGPRPHAPGTCAAGRLFETVTERYATRHCVKPGMTGLAQIRGWRGETDTEEKLLRRLDSDLEYIATWSPRNDLLILWHTIVEVLRMPNAY
ncbi:MAG: polysaccharide biosynthesis protein PslA [Acetobacteraceae bacterium]|jgi:polysaccharide biosynthesis protein PslA|nr:polysaccharide biosynthesis protein PslA [Acetobacteraceae bacterium]